MTFKDQPPPTDSGAPPIPPPNPAPVPCAVKPVHGKDKPKHGDL
jgi:hypothetical protein